MKKISKQLVFTAISAVIAFCITALSLAACKTPVDPPAVPVITITVQPAAVTNVMEGSITGSLNVQAEVTEGAVLNYQWYASTVNSNTEGSLISGAASADFAIPAALTEGTYYYYCKVSAEGAVSVSSNAAVVNVAELVVDIAIIT